MAVGRVLVIGAAQVAIEVAFADAVSPGVVGERRVALAEVVPHGEEHRVVIRISAIVGDVDRSVILALRRIDQSEDAAGRGVRCGRLAGDVDGVIEIPAEPQVRGLIPEIRDRCHPVIRELALIAGVPLRHVHRLEIRRQHIVGGRGRERDVRRRWNRDREGIPARVAQPRIVERPCGGQIDFVHERRIRHQPLREPHHTRVVQ